MAEGEGAACDGTTIPTVITLAATAVANEMVVVRGKAGLLGGGLGLELSNRRSHMRRFPMDNHHEPYVSLSFCWIHGGECRPNWFAALQKSALLGISNRPTNDMC
jgi:hypothetical protein